MKERNRLGYRIRSLREESGLTKSEFSRRVGVTPTAVHNWEENGVVPRHDMITEICRVLRVDEADLQSSAPSPKTDTGVAAELRTSPEEAIEEAKRLVATAYRVERDQVSISVSF